MCIGAKWSSSNEIRSFFSQEKCTVIKAQGSDLIVKDSSSNKTFRCHESMCRPFLSWPSYTDTFIEDTPTTNLTIVVPTLKSQESYSEPSSSSASDLNDSNDPEYLPDFSDSDTTPHPTTTHLPSSPVLDICHSQTSRPLKCAYVKTPKPESFIQDLGSPKNKIPKPPLPPRNVKPVPPPILPRKYPTRSRRAPVQFPTALSIKKGGVM